MRCPTVPIVLTAAFLSLASVAGSTFAADKCEKLASLDLPDTTIVSAKSMPAGPMTTPKQPSGLSQPTPLPSFCRVELRVEPAINIEVWMPTAGWNGNFQAVGDQGNAGYINYADMVRALNLGYATASTDAGHRFDSPPGETGIEFAYGHPELVVDWAYRAVHEMTLKSKEIIKSFYGTGPRVSYFTACSNGGRQALVELQRYPNDYDGVLAGAPQANMTGSIAGEALWSTIALLKEPDSYVPSSKLPAIADAALEACDAKDGIKDGIIDDPQRCQFDPSVIICKEGDSPTCLTAKQVEAVKELYSGPPLLNGKSIYPGFMPGSERGWAFSVGTEPYKSANYQRTEGFFKYIVYSDVNWDWHTWDYSKDLAGAKAKLSVFEAMDPNLKPFHAHGGKLILYHGWADPIIPPLNTVNYYKSIIATIGTQADDTVRLFMVPGMGHCGGGSGPNTFDAFGPLVNWVEHKQAPEKIIASNAPNNALKRTRPLCAYPKTAQYTGQGSTDDAASFVCALPNSN